MVLVCPFEMVAQRQVVGFDTGLRDERRSAPWRLCGDSFIMLYHLPREFVLERGFVPAELAERFVGGTGALILSDYKSSEVGPFRELLFVPGKFEWQGRAHYAATKVFTSTDASLTSGRENWGLPSERAQFYFDRYRKADRLSVGIGGRIFADLTFRAGRIGLPVTTDLVPVERRTLLQPRSGRFLLTSPEGQGSLRRANLLDARFDGELFPDLSGFEPKMSLRVVDFDVLFPEAVVTSPSLS